jgi:hypothetical protein
MTRPFHAAGANRPPERNPGIPAHRFGNSQGTDDRASRNYVRGGQHRQGLRKDPAVVRKLSGCSARAGNYSDTYFKAYFGKESEFEPVLANINQETLAEIIGTASSRVSLHACQGERCAELLTSRGSPTILVRWRCETQQRTPSGIARINGSKSPVRAFAN